MTAIAPSIERLRDSLQVDSSDVNLVKAVGGATSPVTSCSSSSSDRRHMCVCDVCFDDVAQDDMIHKICGPTCPAMLCSTCTRSYVKMQAKDAVPGVLAKLNCPVCIVPVNIMRWRRRLSSLSFMNDDSVDAFCAKVERSCEVRCPGCDTNRSQLPKSARNVPKLKLLPSQAVHIPRLRDLCFEFCLHRVAAADVVVFAQSTFGADIGLSIVETMLPLFHDPERRASMYLRLRRQNPFIYTMCCKAPVCFFCHVAGHHNGIACGGVSPDLLDSIVECEDCGLQLVKGDGCDSVQCYCGVNFQWSVEVLKTPMRSMMRSLQPFRRKLRYHISRWVQRLRKNRALEEIKCRYLRIEAKEFWKLYRETHPDEVQDVDDELSLMMSMDFEGC